MGRKCTYSVAWVGTCNKTTGSQSEDRCSKHMNKTCAICGDKATRGCSETMGLVCGVPLCNNSECKQKHLGRAHNWGKYAKKELDPKKYHTP